MSDPLLVLDAILEIQQLRMVARDCRDKGDSQLMHAAYRSARLLCRELRAGLFLRPIPRNRRRTNLTA